MDKIEFKAAYGDEDKDVDLSAPSGGGNGYQIIINRRYYGMIMMQQDKWVIHLNPRASEKLSMDDRQILIDIVKDYHDSRFP